MFGWFSGNGGGAILSADKRTFLATISPGTLIATLARPFGSGTTFVTVGSAPGQLALSSGTVVAGASAAVADQNYSIKIRAVSADGKREAAETLTFGAVAAVASLQALTLSGAGSLTLGTSASGAIGPATVGSTITASGLPTGFTVNGSARTWAYNGTGSASTTNASLVETLAGSPNSPRTSGISITISAASTGAFNITSPTSWSQPSSSTRYVRLTADVPASFAIRSGADGSLFTLGANNILSLASRSYATGGANTSTVNLRATDASNNTVDFSVTVTVSNVAAAQQQSTEWVADFAGTASALLHVAKSTEWTLYSNVAPNYPSIPMLTGAGKTSIRLGNGSEDGQHYVMHNPTGQGTVSVDIEPDGTAYTAPFWNVLASDEDTMIIHKMNINPGTVDRVITSSVYLRQGGTLSGPIASGNLGFSQPKTTITYDYNETSKLLKIRSSFYGGHEIDCTAYDLPGRKFGYGGKSAYDGPTGDVLYSNVKHSSKLGALGFTDVPTIRPGNTATYTLAWTGLTPTVLDHRFLDATTGDPLTAWITGDSTVTGSSGSGAVTYVASSPTFGPAKIECRYHNDTAISAVAGAATVFGLTLPPVTYGANLKKSYYADPCLIYTDWGHDCNDVFGESGQRIMMMPFQGINGYGTIETEPGRVLTAFNGTAGHFTLTPVNVPAGLYNYAITADSNPGDWRGINYSGSAPTLLKVTPSGVSGKFNAVTKSINPGSIRDLEWAQTNYNPSLGTAWDQALIDQINVSYERFVVPPADIFDYVAEQAANDTNFLYHRTEHMSASDAFVRSCAQSLKVKLLATTIVIHEFSNETWNLFLAGGGAFRNGVCNGYKAGYFNKPLYSPSSYVDATYASPNATQVVKVSLNGGFDTTGRGQSPAMTAGDLVFVKIAVNVTDPQSPDYYANRPGEGGLSIYRAKRSVASGGDIVIGADFDLFENRFTELVRAKERWECVRHDEQLIILEDELGTARFNAQIKPAIYFQQDRNFADTNASERWAFKPGYMAKVNIIGESGYVYYAGSDIVDKTDLTAAQLFAALNGTGLDNYRNALRRGVAKATALGKEYGQYETNAGHPEPKYYAGYTLYTQRWDEMMAHPVMAAQQHFDHTKTTIDNGSGHISIFTAAGVTWGYRLRPNDTVHPREDGHLAAIAGGARPN